MSMSKNLFGARAIQAALGGDKKPQGDLILKVSNIDVKAGHVTGEVVNGPAAGTEITVVAPDNTDKYEGALSIKNLASKTNKSFIDTTAGGMISFEGVKAGDNGLYTASWMNAFAGKFDPAEQTLKVDALVNFMRVNPGDSNKPPACFITQIHTDQEKHITSIDELEQAMIDAMQTSNAVNLFAVDPNDGSAFSQSISRGKSVDGEFVLQDAADIVPAIIAEYRKHEEELQALIDVAGMSVVPADRFFVGPTTVKGIEDAIEKAGKNGSQPRFSAIQRDCFDVPSIGRRIAAAVHGRAPGADKLPKDAADKMKAAFMATASESAKEDFLSKKGWPGVSDDDMLRFLANYGVDVMRGPLTCFEMPDSNERVEESGWSYQTVLTRGDSMAVKSHARFKNARPFPPVKALEGLAADFTEQTVSAIAKIIEAPVAEKKAAVSKKDDEKAPSASDAKADDTSKDDVAASAEADAVEDLDDLLSNLDANAIAEIEDAAEPEAGS